ncbi:MAG TPA: DUF4386 domain-containing protein [Natronosporangium sp.]
MTTTTAITATSQRTRWDANRKTAFVAGTFYLLTFVASIPAVFLLAPVLDNPDYIVSAGSDTRVLWGTLLDLVNALACIGTAVALFPLVKRQQEALALGFVTTRVYEAAVIMIGIVSLLAIVTLRQEAAGAAGTDPAALVTTGRSLVAVRDWTFLLGPGFAPALNAVLLGTLLYRSRLVPRAISTIGLIGAPLLLVAFTANLFGITEQVSGWSLLATLPIAAWEFTLGAWLVFRGFQPSPITARPEPVTAGT